MPSIEEYGEKIRNIEPPYPKSLRGGPGWCVASVPLPSGPNIGSNPGEGRELKKKKKI